MKKIVYTRSDDGGVCVITPVSKKDVERVLGPLTDTQYEAHVWDRSVPADAIDPRYVDDSDIPTTREFRNAWVDVTNESIVDICCTRAKDIQLDRLRAERQAKFEELGLPHKLNPDVESALLSKETLETVQQLRDVTEPLKALDTTDQVNNEELLNEIRALGKLS